MLRRRMLLKGGLPNGYKKLEFIRNTSTAYIDTGVDGGHFNKTYAKFNIVEPGYWTGIWGCRTDAPVEERLLTRFTGSQKFWIGHNNIDKTTNITATADTSGTIGVIHEVYYNNGIFTINGKTETYDPTAVFSNNYSCYVFAVHNGWGGTVNACKLKYYSFKMWQDDTLVRDFIPCRHISDNTVGLYDLVEGKFYTSPNGTAFVGSDEPQTTDESLEGEIIEESEEESTDFIPEYSGETLSDNI